MSFVFGIALLLAIVIGIIFGIRFLAGRRKDEPSADLDLIAYALLAIAVGVATFAVAGLARAAFPEDTFIGTTGEQVATSLAGIVVAGPIAVFLWQRQAKRRHLFPENAGWPIYLAVIEAIFMTATVVSAFNLVNWAIGDGNRAVWTDLVVFGGVVILHEWAAHRTPPGSDAAGLPRVVGSVVGLIPTAIGATAVLVWVFEQIYGSLFATVAGIELGWAVSLVIVGAPVWWYRWWRPWPGEPKGPRKVWLVVAAVTALAITLGSVVASAIMIVTYVFGDPMAAGDHFSPTPVFLSMFIVGLGVWSIHRRGLGQERTTSLRAYEYIMAAISLSFLVGSATALSALAFGEFAIVGPADASIPLSIVVLIVVSLTVWWWYWSKAQHAPREEEAPATPRRVYLLGMGVISGLTAAQALIATLVILFQRVFDAGGSMNTLAVQASLFVFSGAATWHLLRVNAQDRELLGREEVVTPFALTVVCSHPGPLATLVPKAATLRIVYRGDEDGVIDESMAEEIVTQVGNKSSIVWVEAGAFKVAPARFD